MVTFQSSLQRLREGRIDTVQFVREVQTQGGGCLSLLLGIGIGLIVGLLIGWVFWPVEWQGASLRELRPEARLFTFLPDYRKGSVMRWYSD